VINPRAATGQCACGFDVKVPRVGGLASEAKKLTDEGRNFSFIEQRPLPRAFYIKARSHCPITALCDFFEIEKDRTQSSVAGGCRSELSRPYG
jgi:hypothetical protein